MLVLSRKQSQNIIIQAGKYQIEVVVAEIRGDKIRIGVTAEKDVAIDRGEVWYAKKYHSEKPAKKTTKTKAESTEGKSA